METVINCEVDNSMISDPEKSQRNNSLCKIQEENHQNKSNEIMRREKRSNQYLKKKFKIKENRKIQVCNLKSKEAGN